MKRLLREILTHLLRNKNNPNKRTQTAIVLAMRRNKSGIRNQLFYLLGKEWIESVKIGTAIVYSITDVGIIELEKLNTEKVGGIKNGIFL